MAAYPSTLTVLAEYEETRIDGFVGLRATNGKLKVRKLMDGEKQEWTILHNLTSADRTTLENFYQANKYLSFDFTFPGVGTYTCKFLSAPKYRSIPGGWFKCSVRIGEE
jgi:hypothetical protein